MRIALSVLALMALVVVAFAGETASWWDLDDAREASKLEIKMGKAGEVLDVEYHIAPDRVPLAVQKAMEAIYGTTSFPAAEKEYEGGENFYELTVVVGGMKHEVMFTPDGQVHSKEIEVEETDPAYPELPAIKADMVARYAGATDVALEVILDANDQLVEYHVKLVTGKGTPDEKHHKLIVQPDGYLSGAYLEVVAELEVPMPTR